MRKVSYSIVEQNVAKSYGLRITDSEIVCTSPSKDFIAIFKKKGEIRFGSNLYNLSIYRNPEKTTDNNKIAADNLIWDGGNTTFITDPPTLPMNWLENGNALLISSVSDELGMDYRLSILDLSGNNPIMSDLPVKGSENAALIPICFNGHRDILYMNYGCCWNSTMLFDSINNTSRVLHRIPRTFHTLYAPSKDNSWILVCEQIATPILYWQNIKNGTRYIIKSLEQPSVYKRTIDPRSWIRSRKIHQWDICFFIPERNIYTFGAVNCHSNMIEKFFSRYLWYEAELPLEEMNLE